MSTPRLDSQRHRFASLLLVALAVIAAPPAHAQSYEGVSGDPGDRVLISRAAHARSGSTSYARPARVATGNDSVWVGHSIQIQNPLDHTTFSYGPFHVGVGLNRPQAGGSAAENSGLWDWDHFQGESDSLQGWWPMRRVYSITGGLTIPDDQRPWWAVDIGNQGNDVLNSANGRTRGVVSYWHVDGGSLAPQVKLPGTNALPMTWAPLDGGGSAWCGLRAHGDVTYNDPITGNPYNAMVLELNGENGGGVASGWGTNKKFPGYPSQMDQMLYRDVEMTSSSATLTLSFLYRTAMSTTASSTSSTRAGWFQFDPTVVGPVAVAGPNAGVANYVANTGIGQPADSFMVYIGVPVDIDAVYLADGSLKTPGPTLHGVYDLKRRWFSEVLRLDMPIQEVLHVSGNTNSSFSLPGQALAAFYNAQGPSAHKYLRIVFRAKTNRGFDDLNASTAGAFSSGGVGAVLIDDVTVSGTDLSGGAIGTSGFDSPAEIDNRSGTDALAMSAWRATGKPPAVFFHNHPLAGGDVGGGNLYAPLTYQDICGPPGSPARFCNLAGVVISAGDHDHGEAAGGLTAGTPERERMDGMLSPTILLASTGAGDYNACGIDHNDAVTTDDYYVQYDIYTGIFNLLFTGNAVTFGFQSYPGGQSDGVPCWGEIRYPGFQIQKPDVQCLTDVEGAKQNGLIRTVNAGSTPDSIRVFLGKNQQCFRFGVTGSACSSTAGAYFDNVSLLLSDAPAPPYVFPSIAVDIWQWINDTFPANDGTSPVPGVAVAPGTAGFDTAAAYIKTGFNTAQSTQDANRFDIPGDSVVVVADAEDGTNDSGARVDMIFRIKPGVGTYVTIGDPTSGLRRLPTSTDPVVAGVFVSDPAHPEKDFWSAYMADPGQMSKGVHGPGNFWNRNVWNSARIDTAEINLFPLVCQSQFCDINFTIPPFMATYHESDPKYNILGIAHNRCFLINPAGAQNSTNITCSSVPPIWGPAQGYDGVPTTKEGTKIIPDGLLTPGAHVEYFFRAQAGVPVNPSFITVPETTFVTPQPSEGSTDGHRWQEFSVLPDRWKDPTFGDGGQGMACMLYVDLDDRRGDERVWVSIADSLGLTGMTRRGAHNGWHANCDDCLTDAAGNPIDVSLDPSIARYDHGGQPGTLWDMYGVRGAESLTASAGQLGSRMGPQATGLATGKDSKQGPTPAMLRTYYKMLLLLSGDLSAGILGPFVNRGQNDVALLQDYLLNPAPGTPTQTRRVLMIEGSGFVQSEYATGTTGTFSSHLSLLTNYLGVTIKTDGGTPQYSYQPWSGNFNPYADVSTAGPIPGEVYSAGNACLWGNDVLDVVSNALNATASSYYQDAGFPAHAPYVSGVYTPIQIGKFYESYVDGWDIQHLFSHFDQSSLGRLGYIFKVFNQVQAQPGLCPFVDFFPPLGVPGAGGKQLVDFMSIANNPLVSGAARVTLGLAKGDRVTVRIYDVSGRMVRTLADRNFSPGQYDLVWDGSDDRGRSLRRGVYFADARYAKSGFREARKLIVLR